jgi:hypothetical protein
MTLAVSALGFGFCGVIQVYWDGNDDSDGDAGSDCNYCLPVVLCLEKIGVCECPYGCNDVSGVA